jgi:hypothetical protein
MGATVVSALFCVALFNDNEWWRATLGTITTAMILNALLAGVFLRGERQAYSLSYFLGAVFFATGIYTYAISLPYLITVKVLELSKALATHPPSEENFFVVATIFWLQVTCFSSAYLGRLWYRRRLESLAPLPTPETATT